MLSLRQRSTNAALSAFDVTVRTTGQRITYQAIGTDSSAVLIAAIDRFGPCAISVKPAKE
jgi:hypothetical protein